MKLRFAVRGAFACMVLSTSLGPTSAWATTVVAQTLAETVQGSDAVVEGEVLAGESFRGENGRVYTDFRVRVVRAATSPSLPTEITVRQLGGTLGRFGAYVAGTPRLAVSTRAVWCLNRVEPSGVYAIRGVYQGFFRIHEVPATAGVAAVPAFRRVIRLPQSTWAEIQPLVSPTGEVEAGEFLAWARDLLSRPAPPAGSARQESAP